MNRERVSFPLVEGVASRQAHVDLPPGTYERELSREGFSGAATQMYHRHPPTAWSSVEGPLRPRAFRLTSLDATAASPWGAPSLLRNPYVELRFWRLSGSMPALARNADGDQLLFIHQGEGELFCDYGHLAIRAGDYVLMPRGTMWRLQKTGAPFAILLIEATNDTFQLPERGLVGRHAIFDPAMLDVPRIDEPFRAQQTTDGWRVEIKRRNQLSVMSFPFNPLDAVGWHGDLAPVRLNLADIRPLMSHRAHLPPSAHTTFVAPRLLVGSFVPRPFESDSAALKVPFFHNNDDYDEVIFYHAGKFFSRDNIGPGMLTLHPSGITHGPHPKALARAFTPAAPATDEYAVMLDLRDPLDVAADIAPAEMADYVDSWKAPAP